MSEKADELLSRAQSVLREATLSRERQPQPDRVRENSILPEFIEQIILDSDMLTAKEQSSNAKTLTSKTENTTRSKHKRKSKKKKRKQGEGQASCDSDYDTDLEETNAVRGLRADLNTCIIMYASNNAVIRIVITQRGSQIRCRLPSSTASLAVVLAFDQ